MQKLFRIATVPESLDILLRGQLRYLNQFYDVTAISSGGDELEDLEKREEVKTHAISMKRSISPLWDLLSLWKLYRYFRKEKPTIVHSITPKAGLLAMIAAYLAGVPVRMHTFTGLIFPYKTGMMKYVLILMDKLLCACATHIYPEGKGVKYDLERYRITRKNLNVIANGNVNGIDLHHFDPRSIALDEINLLREHLEVKENDFVFIFLGRIVKDKGVNELISAFKSISELVDDKQMNTTIDNINDREQIDVAADRKEGIAENYFSNISSVTGLKLRNRLGKIIYPQHGTSSVYLIPEGDIVTTKTADHNTPLQTESLGSNVKLLLVGSMQDKQNPILGLTRAEIERNPHIIRAGFVKDVRPYLALADCLVLPSYREGFPNAVLQAGAMNLPCIVSDINGCNEIITNGINGLVVPAKSEEKLEKAMLKLLSDYGFMQQLKLSSRVKIKELYSHRFLWEALLSEYATALKKNRSAE